ncbi:hypothetical protein GCM10022243_52480 [Saccharothrix violaceirubra]|uniref:Uncharacterized protein n=1 Tax=Saccharothrix violaceirubra TaxID=413306 RepID=A0A7W7X028_9PSEU|nr:hypothetical protein [Saccharothrix violaceirubra]MBB4969451.1 hypothetical protein [Saccharothrix violaceirubra]
MSTALRTSVYLSLTDHVEIAARIAADDTVEITFDREADLLLTPGAFLALTAAFEDVSNELLKRTATADAGTIDSAKPPIDRIADLSALE